ncbi:MAG: MBL fold metallo-hydrolase [Deltaproteobacteria bacterium]|nr:MBL fold metallo-hydrolase [Deltaproteobacteria bacterium]MBW2052997.1 MBL fold metallo-hydrolase [Deltaproteobacteria bacterium]MBW2141632.1 MBL fold metallo-hydrolase [Deltaproteobacteria bacterium]
MTKVEDTQNTNQETGMKNPKEFESAIRPEKNQAFQVIRHGNVKFEHPHPNVYVARILIANASWVKTTEGTVLIDTLIGPAVAKKMFDKIHETSGPVKYIIYTHGHMDHVGGANVFTEDSPEIIAQRYIMERFEKYRILAEHRARIGRIQFNLPFLESRGPSFVNPTRLYDESMTFTLGDKTFELYHARAETDDHTWVFVPEIRAAFVGDLIVAGYPNVGNPFKPTRFALSWARALEAVREKEPEMVVAHGGHAVYQGDEAREILDVNIEAIKVIHDQVVEYINKDIPVDEMIQMVKLPDHLKDHRYLRFVYSRPEFAVYNIYRWYHGYFDHNPAHLLPRPEKEVNEEVFQLIGDGEAILKRAGDLLEQGQAQLALQILDILLKHSPEDTGARKLHLKILEVLHEEDYCLMSRNTWVYFMERDKEILGIKD